MSKEITLLRQLQELKAVTVRTSALHEAQTLQIRNYPLLIPGVTKAQATVNVEQKIVTYDCVPVQNFRLTKNAKNMCNNIKVWIKTLLWDETAVIIKVKDRIIYDSRSK